MQHHPQYPHYQPPPMPPAYPYPNGKRTTSAENLTLPLAAVCAVLAVTSGGAWWAGGQFTTLNNAIERLTEKVSTLAGPINERISRVEQQLMAGNASRWTRADQVVWCARTEQQNQGWRCADAMMAAPDPNIPPIWATEINGGKR